jgi:hypothetical protein
MPTNWPNQCARRALDARRSSLGSAAAAFAFRGSARTVPEGCRSMKMGRYDSIAGDTLQLASLGCSAIQHCASWIPDIVGWFG